jgi:low affinity Fe/Cu permease
MDQRIALIALGVALAVVVGYVLVMRVFFRESKELDKKIDYSKMKEWKDEED